MPENIPTPGAQHPEEWRADLNPNAMAGQNLGLAAEAGGDERSAYDVKDVHRRLTGFTDDELKQIPVVATGARLQQGATYLDLLADTPEEFTATGEMTADAGHCYVNKSDVHYELWNRLLGLRDPRRTGTAG
jgi:hypothetical protein